LSVVSNQREKIIFSSFFPFIKPTNQQTYKPGKTTRKGMEHSQETLTLQFGTLAGHTMTHFWNIQSDYMLNRSLARGGLFCTTSDKLLPRCVMVDTKKGTGGASVVNPWVAGGDAVSADVQSWNKVDTIDKTQPNTYMDAVEAEATWDAKTGYKSSEELGVEQVAAIWPAYSKVYHHAKSSVVVPSTASDEIAFDKELNIDYDNGTADAWEEDGLVEQVLEAMRFQMESTDNLRSIHAVVDVFTKWQQVCSSVLEQLRDDGMRVDIVSWALDDIRSWSMHSIVSTVLQKESQRNRFIGLYSLSQQSTLVVPITAPDRRVKYLKSVDWSKPWQSASVFASLIDTAMIGLSDSVKPHHLPLTSLSACYPFVPGESVKQDFSNLWDFSARKPGKLNLQLGTLRGCLARDEIASHSRVPVPLYDAYPQHFLPEIVKNQAISVYTQWESCKSVLERELAVRDGMAEFEEINGWYQDEHDHIS